MKNVDNYSFILEIALKSFQQTMPIISEISFMNNINYRLRKRYNKDIIQLVF